MKHYRSTTTKDDAFNYRVGKQYKDIPSYVSCFGSNEGVVDMTSLMFDYFDNNDYLYGKSSLFITYFWVPRQLWPTKPTMIGHWLVRETRSGFGNAHSASFGFTGFLYTDFGMFSLIFIFFIGRALKYAENYKNIVLKNKSYSMIIGAMLYPYIFFFVRSPITATMNFIGILFMYYFFKRLIFSR